MTSRTHLAAPLGGALHALGALLVLLHLPSDLLLQLPAHGLSLLLGHALSPHVSLLRPLRRHKGRQRHASTYKHKKNQLSSDFNPEWSLNFRDPPKNLVLKLQTAISPKVSKSDKQFLLRSIEDNQGFHFGF